MMTTVGIIGFIVVLLLSVMLHEWGHFATARRFGMKATEFFVGFGPRLWSIRRGETEYGVKAIPAGGYVKIVGMTDLEEIDPADEPRAFYRKPARQRAVVLAAGSFMHFVLAFVLFVTIPMVFGHSKATLTVDKVPDCVWTDTTGKQTSLPTTCGPDTVPAPAWQAGLRPGDTIVSLDGKRLKTWQEFTAAVKAAGARQVTIVVRRDGRELTLRPTLIVQKRADGTGKTVQAAVLGVTSEIVVERAGPVEALGEAVDDFQTMFLGTFKALGQIPASIPALFRQTFGDEPRDPNGLVGAVGIAVVSGQVLDEGSDPLPIRIGSFLGLMAGINIFIGIFNLLPLLPLDGGHLAVLVFEESRRRLYRLLGRPDPGRVDLMKLMPAAYLFLVLLIGLSVLLVAADIVNPPKLSL
ncbi:Peptidase M50 [Carbonactinospora thermoautotrophica]|uniref:Peptidase M50 n=2 Tax=Carbonactinospora thermoautotrophica TaxID=1469144 RepID=A0A132MPA4_9ACTN|nr:site-2 protease family protein [Carbonactinospora thermoautotrophica]KWW99694.1 Peptidase M50 [Carbonactinospora thermoautotrophica]